MRQSSILILGVIGACGCLMSCTSTQITSFRDPGFKDNTFTCLIVASNDPDLRYRQAIETTMAGKLKEAGIKAPTSLEVMPPTRTYTVEQYAKALAEYGCGGALLLNVKGGGRQVTYINGMDGSSNPWITSSVTGEATVLDTKTMQPAWKASVTVSHDTPIPFGNGISSMIDDATSKVTAKLIEDKVIPSISGSYR